MFTQNSPDISKDALAPRIGGHLVFAVNDFPSGWNPASSVWSGSSTTMARAFLDPLVVLNEDGSWAPYLADFVSNEESTSWLIKLKEDVVFHNGEQLNAEVLVANLENSRNGILLGPPLGSITDIFIEDSLTVRINLNESNANFPVLFTSQGGYVFALETINKFKEGDASRPIGTGPWKFEAQDAKKLVTNKNPNYWKQDSNGISYPYINRITFLYAPDLQSRKLGVENQDFDAVLENTPLTLANWNQKKYPQNFSLLIDDNFSDRTYGNFNTQTGVFNDRRLREAIVLGTDRNTITQMASGGYFSPTDGPYSLNSKWYVPSGLPEEDPVQAKNIIQQWISENGGIAPQVKLVVSQGVLNLSIGQELKQQWEELGFNVTLVSLPTEEFVVQLVQGQFDVSIVQQFTGLDPIADESFWKAQTVAGPGEIGLNFPRFTNGTIEQALTQARASSDYETRKNSYGTVWKEWARQYPYLFLYNSQIAVLSTPRVQNMGVLTASNGEKVLPFSWGATWLTETWVRE